MSNCWVGGKQCRPWSDAALCGVWSGSALFTQACLSEYVDKCRKFDQIEPQQRSSWIRPWFFFVCLFYFRLFILFPTKCCDVTVTSSLISLFSIADQTFANSIDPDEMAHAEPSHLDLCCLLFCCWFLLLISIFATMDVSKLKKRKSPLQNLGWKGKNTWTGHAPWLWPFLNIYDKQSMPRSDIAELSVRVST